MENDKVVPAAPQNNDLAHRSFLIRLIQQEDTDVVNTPRPVPSYVQESRMLSRVATISISVGLFCLIVGLVISFGFDEQDKFYPLVLGISKVAVMLGIFAGANFLWSALLWLLLDAGPLGPHIRAYEKCNNPLL